MAGFRGYQIDPNGLAEIGRGEDLQKLCLQAAERAARWANNQDPAGDYQVAAAGIPSGEKEEIRAGATITQMKDSYQGTKQRVLLRSVVIAEAQ